MNTSWPPPQPAVWAPNLRGWCTRFCRWMDERQARQTAARLHRQAADSYDRHWYAQYAAWWETYGWEEGADNPDVALRKARTGLR